MYVSYEVLTIFDFDELNTELNIMIQNYYVVFNNNDCVA